MSILKVKKSSAGHCSMGCTREVRFTVCHQRDGEVKPYETNMCFLDTTQYLEMCLPTVFAEQVFELVSKAYPTLDGWLDIYGLFSPASLLSRFPMDIVLFADTKTRPQVYKNLMEFETHAKAGEWCVIYPFSNPDPMRKRADIVHDNVRKANLVIGFENEYYQVLKNSFGSKLPERAQTLVEGFKVNPEVSLYPAGLE